MVPSYILRPLPNGLSLHDILEIIRYLISLVLPEGLTVNLRELIRRISNRMIRKGWLAASVNMTTGRNHMASTYHRLHNGVKPPVGRKFLQTMAPIAVHGISRSLPNKYRTSVKSKEIPLRSFAQSRSTHGGCQEGLLRPRNGRQ